LLFKPTPKSTFYVTRNDGQAVLGSNHFGGVGLNSNDKATLEQALKSKSVLTEVGYKGVYFDNKFYFTTALYKQNRADPDKYGNVYDRRSKGVEFETVIQPSKHFYLLSNFTYQDITRKDSAGVISRTRGTSRWLANSRVNYKFDSGFGGGIGPQFAGSQIGSGTTVIHSQYRIDATLYYSTKEWDFQVNIYNLTNRANWSMMDTEFDGGTAVKERPLSASFTTRYRF
jgi:outer membrane receptor for monomeric catechols